MDINIIGNVLLDLFEIEAFVGLALLAVVLVVLARALLADHRVGPHTHHQAHR